MAKSKKLPTTAQFAKSHAAAENKLIYGSKKKSTSKPKSKTDKSKSKTEFPSKGKVKKMPKKERAAVMQKIKGEYNYELYGTKSQAKKARKVAKKTKTKSSSSYKKSATASSNINLNE